MTRRTGRISSNARRKYAHVGGRRHNPIKVLARRQRAHERMEAREGRTPETQWARLNVRLGEGGAVKERKRLIERLERELA